MKICNICKKSYEKGYKNTCRKCYFKEWRKENLENDRKKSKEWRNNNLEKASQNAKEWRKRNTQYASEYYKKYSQTLNGKIKSRIRDQKRRYNERVGNLTSSLWLNFTLPYFNYSCAYCGISSTDLELEHVLSVSNGGTFDVHNIVPACRECNRGINGKHRKSLEIFASQESIKLIKEFSNYVHSNYEYILNNY